LKVKWSTICFDLDNTLYNHEFAFKRAIKQCYYTKIHRWKISVDQAPPFEAWFTTFKYYCDHFWPELEHKRMSGLDYRRARYAEAMREHRLPVKMEEADDFHNEYYEIVHQFAKPDPMMGPLLKWLSDIGVKVGILTNGPSITQRNKIEALGLNQFVEEQHLLISSETGLEKPDPRFFHLMEQTFQMGRDSLLNTDTFLFIGDSWEQDVEGAVAAGWDAVYLNTREIEPSSHVNVVTNVHSLSDIYVWLQTYGRGGR
jgi:putative hydrolase of the HAD superfamily